MLNYGARCRDAGVSVGFDLTLSVQLKVTTLSIPVTLAPPFWSNFRQDTRGDLLDWWMVFISTTLRAGADDLRDYFESSKKRQI